MINTNTRHLRKVDGFYYNGGRAPCEVCGLAMNCPMKPVKACKFTVPVLGFQDETGLDKLANTVRVGTSWHKRLEPGQAVGLFNSAKGELFGYADVVGVFSGPIASMMATHAHANHLMLDKGRREAAIELIEWQRRQYGPRIINKDSSITAIYLLRRSGAPAFPVEQESQADRSA